MHSCELPADYHGDRLREGGLLGMIVFVCSCVCVCVQLCACMVSECVCVV